MIRHDMPQGSTEWMEARLGLPTASQFHRLLTKARLAPAAGASTYLYELLAARFIGEPTDGFSDEWTIRGTQMEEEAVRWYEFQRDVTCETVGFITTDDGRIGCSPDRLVGDDGGLEIKCPSAKVHVATLLGEHEHEHRCQVQGCLWVTGREWWDLLIYSPALPPLLRRYEPDQDWIDAFEGVVYHFLSELDAGMARLRDLGAEIPAPAVSKPRGRPSVASYYSDLIAEHGGK